MGSVQRGGSGLLGFVGLLGFADESVDVDASRTSGRVASRVSELANCESLPLDLSGPLKSEPSSFSIVLRGSFNLESQSHEIAPDRDTNAKPHLLSNII